MTNFNLKDSTKHAVRQYFLPITHPKEFFEEVKGLLFDVKKSIAEILK